MKVEREELEKVLIENFKDEDGVINLSSLNFDGYDVNISGMVANKLKQTGQDARTLHQDSPSDLVDRGFICNYSTLEYAEEFTVKKVFKCTKKEFLCRYFDNAPKSDCEEVFYLTIEPTEKYEYEFDENGNIYKKSIETTNTIDLFNAIKKYYRQLDPSGLMEDLGLKDFHDYEIISN